MQAEGNDPRSEPAPSAHGAIRWRVLRAGGFRLDGGGMFGLIPRTMWEKWTPPDALNRIGLAMNCVLLEPGEGARGAPGAEGTGSAGAVAAMPPRRVLVETGAGSKWTPAQVTEYEFERQPDGAIRTVEHALAEAGVTPKAITDVVLSHLHFDHAGGLTRWASGGNPSAPHAPEKHTTLPLELVFPNARIHVQRQEWEDALANRSTMTRTYLRTHLDPIADRVVRYEGEAEPVPGVHVRPLVGHTWGQQGVLWQDERGTVCFPGDLLPTVHHSHPASSLGYDMLPYDTMLTKRALLGQAEREGWRLVLDHEPGPCVVTVRGGRLVAVEPSA